MTKRNSWKSFAMEYVAQLCNQYFNSLLV